MAKPVIVFITGPSVSVIRKIGLKLVKERLAACVNVIPRVDSIFYWEGKLCSEREALMVVKTTVVRFQKLMKRVKQLHPYTVPEIIALPIVKGSADYLNWIQKMTR
jgi:periplasmic divalent cation tolerance protein